MMVRGNKTIWSLGVLFMAVIPGCVVVSEDHDEWKEGAAEWEVEGQSQSSTGDESVKESQSRDGGEGVSSASSSDKGGGGEGGPEDVSDEW